MNKFCEKCGSALNEGAAFCYACGSAVVSVKQNIVYIKVVEIDGQ